MNKPKKELNETLARRIRSECFTYAEFARRLGVTRTTVYQLLYGMQHWTAENIVKACEILHVEMPEEMKAMFFSK